MNSLIASLLLGFFGTISLVAADSPATNASTSVPSNSASPSPPNKAASSSFKLTDPYTGKPIQTLPPILTEAMPTMPPLPKKEDPVPPSPPLKKTDESVAADAASPNNPPSNPKPASDPQVRAPLSDKNSTTEMAHTATPTPAIAPSNTERSSVSKNDAKTPSTPTPEQQPVPLAIKSEPLPPPAKVGEPLLPPPQVLSQAPRTPLLELNDAKLLGDDQREVSAENKPAMPKPMTAPVNGTEISVILAENRFYPSKILIRDGESIRLIFTTVNPRPAALILEGLSVSRWVRPDEPPAGSEESRARWELDRQLTSNRLTEITIEPHRGTYSFHDALTGATGEITVE